MTRYNHILVSALAVIGSAVAGSNSLVKDLLPSNFDDVVLKSGKPALVEFFAPWCGHCKNLAPVYEELAQSFASSESKLTIAKVDADAEKSLGSRFGVQGFPTLKWFDGKSDKPEDYNSGRDLESLQQFITQKTGLKPKTAKKAPSEVVMMNEQSFAKEVGKDKNIFVAFTAPWCGHCKSLAPTWETLAHDFASEPDVVIAKVDAEAPESKQLAKDQGVTGFPTIKFFPAGSTTAVPYEGGRSESAFLAFLNDKAGTHRAVGGGLDALGGTIEVMNAAVDRVLSSGEDLAEGLENIKLAAQGVTSQAQKASAGYYVKVAEKVGQNKEYVEKELKRLQGLLAKGGLAPAKRDELTGRSNILRRFQKKAEEAVEGIKGEL